MGALGNSGDSRKFVNTFNGKFTIKGKDGDKGIVKRINKNNKEVFELHFDTLSDVLVQGIEKRTSEEYGNDWKFLLAHTKSDELFSLTLPYSSRLTMGIFLRLPNIDFKLPITLKLYYFDKDDKSALVVYQGTNKVNAFWTKENPADLPQMEQITVKNELVWDSSKRMIFIEKYLADKVIPMLNDVTEESSEPQAVHNEGTSAVGGSESAKPDGKEVAKEGTIEWDIDITSLKGQHPNGKYYACNEDGTFKKDENKELISALPF